MAKMWFNAIVKSLARRREIINITVCHGLANYNGEFKMTGLHLLTSLLVYFKKGMNSLNRNEIKYNHWFGYPVSERKANFAAFVATKNSWFSRLSSIIQRNQLKRPKDDSSSLSNAKNSCISAHLWKMKTMAWSSFRNDSATARQKYVFKVIDNM